MEPGPLDRLRLTEDRIAGMAQGLRDVAALPDPVGEVVDGWTRPNGLRIERVRVPLGVVAIIYENRPNVTSDAAGICLKSGNVALLRGSATALRSNLAIADVLREGATKAGLPADCVLLVDDVRHEAAVELMQLTDVVDCLIPRGGPSLIQSIREHATVPVVIDGDGNCQVYVDASADLDQRARHRGERQDEPARACATRRSRCSCTRRSPTSSCRGSPARSPTSASSWSATTAHAPAGRGWARPPTTTSPPSSSRSS